LYKKLFEFPVERDFAKEKAFHATQYPSIFQIFFRIRFFDIEVRFFGTAINGCDSETWVSNDDDDPVIEGIFRPRSNGEEKQRLVFLVQNSNVATGQSEPLAIGIQHWYGNTIFIIFTPL
jgi:hypothetical protein